MAYMQLILLLVLHQVTCLNQTVHKNISDSVKSNHEAKIHEVLKMSEIDLKKHAISQKIVVKHEAQKNEFLFNETLNHGNHEDELSNSKIHDDLRSKLELLKDETGKNMTNKHETLYQEIKEDNLIDNNTLTLKMKNNNIKNQENEKLRKQNKTSENITKGMTNNNNMTEGFQQHKILKHEIKEDDLAKYGRGDPEYSMHMISGHLTQGLGSKGHETRCEGLDGGFRCLDGKCIPGSMFCDGNIDCNDGSDENLCAEHTPYFEFCNKTNQYICADRKTCIPDWWVCDGEKDCHDASDEVNCTNHLPTTLFKTNATSCKGFSCDNGTRCISQMWACDGQYDCADKSDEHIEMTCRNAVVPHTYNVGLNCFEMSDVEERNYKCLDSSFCLPPGMMCDGMADCRDASDEGSFCQNWATMCSNVSCHDKLAKCEPDRGGPSCRCLFEIFPQAYNNTSKRCEQQDRCLAVPQKCSHRCESNFKNATFRCVCADGYVANEKSYNCYAPDPEGMLFFATRDSIKYIKIKSLQEVTVLKGIKQGHGVAYDGRYVYWVENGAGHQAVMRSLLADADNNKQIVVALGLEEPGGVAIDWLGGNIYISDSGRGWIWACRADGAYCSHVPVRAWRPRLVTLHPAIGMMYWADWHGGPMILGAPMSGGRVDSLVESLASEPRALALDAPSERLFFVDNTVKAVRLKDKFVYPLFKEAFHHPYAIAVFESLLYWSDWTSETIQVTNKLGLTTAHRRLLYNASAPVFGMYMYHPLLMPSIPNPCKGHSCSHLCLVKGVDDHVCACPEGMALNSADLNNCHPIENYKLQYLVVASKSTFTRFEVNYLGNPEFHATHLDIAWVQAMAYDHTRDVLYLYDRQRKTINHISMKNFTRGVTRMFLYKGFENVVDMAYDYVSDVLYILDEGTKRVDAVSLKSGARAHVYRFEDGEVPVSFCVLPDYGKMLVAVKELEHSDEIHIDSFGLDGSARQHLVTNNLKGPHVKVRYMQDMKMVFISDEGNNVIDIMHPEGTEREPLREISTSVGAMAAVDVVLFWSDRRSPRLYWTYVHEVTHTPRRMDLFIFPNTTQLHIQAAATPHYSEDLLKTHQCHGDSTPCSHVCVQTPHFPPSSSSTVMGYKCLCPPDLRLINDRCVKNAHCNSTEVHCLRSNACVPKSKLCDGVKDCPEGEDEMDCPATKQTPVKCQGGNVLCNGKCIDRHEVCTSATSLECENHQFKCTWEPVCVDRSQRCDGRSDCPDGSDELQCDTHTCLDTEFTCTQDSCISSAWRCDGDEDCPDGSDEIDCDNKTCSQGFYQCRNGECIELRKRCNGDQDCFDFSDEEGCAEQPLVAESKEESMKCAEWEFACEFNKNICVPKTARCNGKAECPGGSDEEHCESRCAPQGGFQCKQDDHCVDMGAVCNGLKDCLDGSDETQKACDLVNKTSTLYPPSMELPDECRHGFRCLNGQCLEWREVCDQTPNCFDGSDENGQCFTACERHNCTEGCRRTPRGPRCFCPSGFRLSGDGRSCADIDECSAAFCPQKCHNVPGTFVCSCHHGYAIRADRRSCKAVRGSLSVVYVSGHVVRTATAMGQGAVLFDNSSAIRAIADIDFDTRKNLLYVASSAPAAVVEVKDGIVTTGITNIGRPSMISLDWVTGNVYFVDSKPKGGRVRVCHFATRKCAKLQKLPTSTQVTAFVVDPGAHRMFYCLTENAESVVWAASLDGSRKVDIAHSHNCTGIGVDSFKKLLYVAETDPSQLIQMDYEGDTRQVFLHNDPELVSPHSLVLFEDYIYFLSGHFFKISRCKLYGDRACEPFMYRVFDAETIVLSHISIQRDDLKSDCSQAMCTNVCVMTEYGPQCVCSDGSLSKDGSCRQTDDKELAQFEVITSQQSSSTYWSLASVLTFTFLLFTIGMCYFLRRQARQENDMPVMFHNITTRDDFEDDVPEIVLPPQMPRVTLANPLNFIRNRLSLVVQQYRTRRGRTQETTSTTSEVHEENFSDTESEIVRRVSTAL